MGTAVGATLAAIAAVGTVLIIPGLNLIVAGPIVAALAGGGVGAVAGGLVGGLVGLGIPERDAVVYNRSLQESVDNERLERLGRHLPLSSFAGFRGNSLRCGTYQTNFDGERIVATNSPSIEGKIGPSEMVNNGRENDHGHWLDRGNDRFRQRRVVTEPKPNSWMIVAAGSIAPLGLAGAALATTYLTKNEKVAIAAWVAVAVVGSASVISAAAVSHRRIVEVDRGDRGTKTTDRDHEMFRTKSD